MVAETAPGMLKHLLAKFPSCGIIFSQHGFCSGRAHQLSLLKKASTVGSCCLYQVPVRKQSVTAFTLLHRGQISKEKNL